MGKIWTTVYDARGMQAAAVNPLTYRTTYVYDAAARPLATRDANSQRTTTVYDLASRPVASINALGNRVSTVYDAVGQKTALVNARGYRWSFSYDAAGQKRNEIDPLARRTTYAYDAAGQQTLKRDARDVRITYSYDTAGRDTGRRYPDGSRVTYAYDANANRVRMQDALGRTTYTYDELDRPRRVTNAYGKSITYVWDALGQRRGLTDPDGGRFTYVYDTVNRFQSVTNPQNERTTCTYDAANRRLEQQNANGTKATYLYDVADQTTRVANRKGDGSMISNLDYRYEPAGNRVGVTEANGDRVTWTYGNTYQLTRERRSGAHAYDTTYIYDPAGNRLQKLDSGARTTSAYDAADQLIYAHDATGRTTFTFDAAGNQQIELAPDGGRTTNVWDYDNMRTGVRLASGIRNTFAYNGDLQRLEKQDTAGTARFTWDQQNILLETDGTNASQAVYTVEPRQYGSLISQRRLTSGIWTPSQNHQDVLGSILQLSSAGATVTDEYLYQAFGNQIAATGTVVNPFRYVGAWGYYVVSDTNMIHVRQRTYAPLSGRWLSADPLAPNQSIQENLNAFQYSLANPLAFIDPSGLVPPDSQSTRKRRPCCKCGARLYASTAYKLPGFVHLCLEVDLNEQVESPLDSRGLRSAVMRTRCTTYQIELLSAFEKMDQTYRFGKGPIILGSWLLSFTSDTSLDASAQSAGGNLRDAWGIWVVPGGDCTSREGKDIKAMSSVFSLRTDQCELAACLIRTGREVGQTAAAQRVKYGVWRRNSNSFISEVLHRCGASFYSDQVDTDAAPGWGSGFTYPIPSPSPATVPPPQPTLPSPRKCPPPRPICEPTVPDRRWYPAPERRIDDGGWYPAPGR